MEYARHSVRTGKGGDVMKKPLKIGIIVVAACVVLYTLAGFLIVPLVLTSVLPDKLSNILERPVSIEKVKINPYALSVTVEQFAIQENEGTERIASLDRLYINLQGKSLFKKVFIFKELIVENPFIHAKRDSSGTINLLTIVPAGKEKESTRTGEASENEPPKAPPVVQFDSIEVSGGGFIFSDASLHSVTEPVSIGIQQLKLTGKNISTAADSRGEIALSFVDDMGGSVSVDGPLGIRPLFTDFNLAVNDWHIVPFRYHVLEKAGMIIEDGKIATTGKIEINEPEEGELKASYKGEASISDFSSVDETAKERFLECKTVGIMNIDAGYNPTFLKIDGISLADFYAALIINPDKTINVVNIAKKGKTAKTEKTVEVTEEKKTKKAPLLLVIKEIQVTNGHINFTDKSIKPTHATDLSGIEGKVSGLSSWKNAGRAEIELTGNIDKTSPVEISGEVDIFSEDLFADIFITLDNKDLSPLTPYSGKYLGYVIDKGKLVLKLEYKIDGKKLDSRNRIFIDQFTLGAEVDSPDAVKLPVKLGVALLKNRKGEIDLDVPVTGRIDAPEFSVGYFVLKIIGNIIEKAVTAPFAFIGSIFGGGEELGYVEFGYGSSQITDKESEKLDILVKALYDRPLLKLGIEGHVDVAKDTESLRRAALKKKVQSAKYDYRIKRGLKSPPVEKIVIEPDEYRDYLVIVYNEGLKEKKAGKEKKAEPVPVEKMSDEEIEQAILDDIAVTDDDLRKLVYERSIGVRDYILSSGKVEKERIFLKEPTSLQDETMEDVKDSRITFLLE